MSDGATPLAAESAPVAEAPAPQTSRDIVASVVADSEKTESTSEAPGYLDTRTTPEVAPPKEPELSAAAKWLIGKGHKHGKRPGSNADLSFMPFTTVEKMLDSYAEEQRNAWSSEVETEAKTLKQQIQQLRSIVSGDPEAFLRELSGIDQRYARYIQQQAQRAAEPQQEEEPQPDLDLGNGMRTYSLEGQKKREAWLRGQLLKQVEEKLKPFQQREEEAHARAEQARIEQEFTQEYGRQISEAQKWPMFGELKADGTMTPFQQAVLDELKKDTDEATKAGRRPTLSLEGAYMRVALPRLTEDDAKKRERLLQELNQAPKSSATPRTSTDAPALKNGPVNTRDVVARTVARLERENA